MLGSDLRMREQSHQFGPFRIVKRLGVGGMAEAFEATRRGPGGFEQRVCLKRVLPAFSENQEFVRQFMREARLAATLRHSNIVGVIDFGNEQGTHYMALELVDGIDLRSLLGTATGHRLPIEQVVLIGLDLAYALDFAHNFGATDTRGQSAPGVVHRDVSPANVLISRAGEVKLADFGIAKAINGTVATASGTVRGKIPYMSPEQMRGMATDGRADLFSLGVLLFEATTGHRPFQGSHDVEIMTRILDGTRHRIDEFVSDVPPALVRAIDRLLELEPEKRTQSASEVIDDLAELAPSMRARRALAALVENKLGGPNTRDHVQEVLLGTVKAEDDERRSDPESPTMDAQLTATELLTQGGFDRFVEMAQAAKASEAPKEETDPVVVPKKRTGALWLSIVLSALVALFWAWPNEGNAPEPSQSSPQVEAKPSPEPRGMVRLSDIPPPAETEPPTLEGTESEITPLEEALEQEAPAPVVEKEIALQEETPLAKAPAPPIPKKKKTRKAKPVKQGKLRAIVVPWGRVWVDGKELGRSGSLITLPVGTHRVHVGRDSKELSQSVRIRHRQTKTITFNLEETD